MIVTRENYPNVYRCCELIWHDNGAVNRLEPQPDAVDFPWYSTTAYLKEVDKVLGMMSADELEEFSIGESSNQREIAYQYGGYAQLFHGVLNRWFIRGMKGASDVQRQENG